MTTSPIIIISEPDPMISGVLRVEFRRWDFAVVLAASCEEAGDYAAQIVDALIVLDSAKAQLAAYETARAFATVPNTPTARSC
jgi:DNA-binding response OmpR family regulator